MGYFTNHQQATTGADTGAEDAGPAAGGAGGNMCFRLGGMGM